MTCQKNKAALRVNISPEDIVSRTLRTEEEIAEIRKLRDFIPLPRAALDDPAFAEREKQQDRQGVVVVFEYGGRLIGSIRAVAMERQTTSSEQILRRHNAAPQAVMDSAWEIGRLVIVPEFRSGSHILKRCLSLAFWHFIHQQKAAHFFAPCLPALARLYRRFGFSALLTDEPFEGCGVFVLTHAMVQDVAGALS